VLLTTNEYVPGSSPETTNVIPVPVEVKAPGFLVNVHVPEAGRLLSETLPFDDAQVGLVILPITGATGVTG
jgi:hypothetical protein